MDVIYLDNAATSWPKPGSVGRAVTDSLRAARGTPGRGGHRPAIEAGAVLERVRRRLGDMTGTQSQRVILTSGATEGLNSAIGGLLVRRRAPGAAPTPPTGPVRIVTTNLEHNAVRRAIRGWGEIARAQVEVTAVACDARGFVSSDEMIEGARAADAIIMTAASNVVGSIQPVGEIGRGLRATGARSLLIVDAAQTAGLIDLNMERDGIDALAFSGHKALLGPPGTGALCLSDHLGAELAPTRFGGTGADSDSPHMPVRPPARFEPGTPNTCGFAGLLAALEDESVAPTPDRLARERAHIRSALGALADLPIRFLGIDDPAAETMADRAPVLSFVADGWTPLDFAAALDASFGIAARAGLHCAPGAHEAFGTLEGGAIRISPGPFTTEADIEALVAAVKRLVS